MESLGSGGFEDCWFVCEILEAQEYWILSTVLLIE